MTLFWVLCTAGAASLASLPAIMTAAYNGQDRQDGIGHHSLCLFELLRLPWEIWAGMPWKLSEHQEALAEGLRKAGLPE